VSGVAGRVAWAAPRTSGSIGIVGAGLAGLLCADRLAGNGVAANVYEAGTVVGGRCRSLRGVFPGQVAELGGELIDTSHTTMRGLANAFGLTLEDYEKQPGDEVYYFGGQYYSEAQVVDEFRAFVAAMRHDLTRLSNGPTAFSYNAYDRLIDNMTLADYLDSRGAGRLLHNVIDTIYTGEYGRQIEEQSALAFLMFIHADKRSKFSPLGQFSDERFHVVEGNDRIATGMAARLPSPVKFGQRLVALKRRADGRYQATFDVGGKLVDVLHDVLVLALPFSVLRTVDLDPSLNLSAGKQRIIREHSYGTNSKMMVGFDRRAWIEDFGSNGGSYSDLSHHQNTWETNAALSNGTRGILTDYTGGRLGKSSAKPATSSRILKSSIRASPKSRGAIVAAMSSPTPRTGSETPSQWAVTPTTRPAISRPWKAGRRCRRAIFFSLANTRTRSTAGRVSWKAHACRGRARRTRFIVW
jgi:monoamine oxidase